MDYQVEFVMRVGVGDLERRLSILKTLPFAPFRDLFLHLPGEDEDLPVEEVVWDAEDERFVCQLRTIALTDPAKIIDLVAHYRAHGWATIDD